MNIKELFTDDSAVSPVIGVILMVAITVILAAVIGSFVLNLGGSLQESAPQATVDYDYDQSATTFSITHESGDSLENDSITVIGSDSTFAGASYDDGNSPYTAGDSIFTDVSYTAGEDIRLVWEDPDSGDSATISSSTAPS